MVGTYLEGSFFGQSDPSLELVNQPSVIAVENCELIVLEKSCIYQLGQILPAFRDTELYCLCEDVHWSSRHSSVSSNNNNDNNNNNNNSSAQGTEVMDYKEELHHENNPSMDVSPSLKIEPSEPLSEEIKIDSSLPTASRRRAVSFEEPFRSQRTEPSREAVVFDLWRGKQTGFGTPQFGFDRSLHKHPKYLPNLSPISNRKLSVPLFRSEAGNPTTNTNTAILMSTNTSRLNTGDEKTQK